MCRARHRADEMIQKVIKVATEGSIFEYRGNCVGSLGVAMARPLIYLMSVKSEIITDLKIIQEAGEAEQVTGVYSKEGGEV